MMHHLSPDALTHNKKKRRSYARIAALVYLCVIFAGALILMLPFCSAHGRFTPFVDCLFTATSATCVTGLIVVDTATHWSLAGKIVILLLIQTSLPLLLQSLHLLMHLQMWLYDSDMEY